MDVLAYRGDGIYLLGTGNGQGVVLHTTPEPPRIFTPPKILDAHLKFGYWEAFEGDAEAILKVAESAVEVVDPRAENMAAAQRALAEFERREIHVTEREATPGSGIVIVSLPDESPKTGN